MKSNPIEARKARLARNTAGGLGRRFARVSLVMMSAALGAAGCGEASTTSSSGGGGNGGTGTPTGAGGTVTTGSSGSTVITGGSGGTVTTGGSGGMVTTGGSGGGVGSGGAGGTGGSACLPATEVCDGLDNDCNGQVDEGCACAAGETQPCYSGDLGTQGIGACKDGSQTCDLAGAWGACAGEILPASEVCNGVDDDCNGTADDMGDLTCGFGVCTVTVSACEGGVPGTCVPKAPSTEICDGLDNDCNQLVDETFPAQGSACDSGLLGVCQPGARQCVAAGGTASEQCVPVQIPTMEACDGLDNDCDGAADDSVPGTGGACATGLLGQCQQGTVLCQGGVVDCHPNIAPAPEVCDGQDNNCDGTVDEGCPLTFSGIQNNLPIAQLVGWSLCYMDTYANQSTTLSTIFTQCNKAKLLLGCRVTGDSTLIVAANAPRADVLLDTGFGNATHDANGVSWYYNTSSSMGFVYQGGAILKNSCDLNSANGSSRLCWHTTGGYLNTGWRCGTTTDLNFIATHERLVFHRD